MRGCRACFRRLKAFVMAVRRPFVLISRKNFPSRCLLNIFWRTNMHMANDLDLTRSYNEWMMS